MTTVNKSDGDSGGLLYDDDNNVVVGICSWAIECANPKYPGVYGQLSTRVRKRLNSRIFILCN